MMGHGNRIKNKKSSKSILAVEHVLPLKNAMSLGNGKSGKVRNSTWPFSMVTDFVYKCQMICLRGT